ncbi:MAG: hypothetical protein IJV69_05340 [Kiritimatiellae bacterium]|nr:hypothetical protein [Kiritimatiellia bacterium]
MVNYELRMMNDELHLALRGEEECVVSFFWQDVDHAFECIGGSGGRNNTAAILKDEMAAVDHVSLRGDR